MRSATECRARMGRMAFGHRIHHTRAEQIRSAREYMDVFDRHLERVCQCGHKRGEHDIAEDFNQPCLEDGCECLDFTEKKESN